MTLNMVISEMQVTQRHTENAYYLLMTLRKAMIAAKEDGKEISQDELIKKLADALTYLEPVVDGVR